MPEIEILKHSELKKKFRKVRDPFPESVRIRIHRSLSWLDRSEQCEVDDHDSKFLFLWIAFNAFYADIEAMRDRNKPELTLQLDFFKKLSGLDSSKRIHSAITDRFSDSIMQLMNNEYVFHAFWEFQHGSEQQTDWQEQMRYANTKFIRAKNNGNTAGVLLAVFSRLYVLRNQLIHGGATWKGRVNRDQVRDGAAILSFLIPVFVDLMMDNPYEDWGDSHYPVVKA